MTSAKPQGLPYFGEQETAAVLDWEPLIDAMERDMVSDSAMDVAAAKLAYDLLTE